MKNSTLLALSTALVFALIVGCKTPPPRTTPLPDPSSDKAGHGQTPNLNMDGIRGSGPGSGVTGTPGGDIRPGDLPNDAVLDGRDQDRSRFANQTVLFEYDRSNVRAAEAAKIDTVISQFKSLPPGHDLLIEGHCDERGTEEYNRALGEHRALSVREIVTKAGIDGQHVFTKSFGKDKPVETGHDDAAWSKNRRAEFILVLPRKITTTQSTQ